MSRSGVRSWGLNTLLCLTVVLLTWTGVVVGLTYVRAHAGWWQSAMGIFVMAASVPVGMLFFVRAVLAGAHSTPAGLKIRSVWRTTVIPWLWIAYVSVVRMPDGFGGATYVPVLECEDELHRQWHKNLYGLAAVLEQTAQRRAQELAAMVRHAHSASGR